MSGPRRRGRSSALRAQVRALHKLEMYLEA